MDQAKRESLLSANNGMRKQMEQLMDSFEGQPGRVSEILRELESLRPQAGSSDGSVTATVDASGVLTDLSLTPAALRRPADELAQLIVQATREAARRAREHSEQAMAPVTEALDDAPEVFDAAEEGARLRDIREFFRDTGNFTR